MMNFLPTGSPRSPFYPLERRLCVGRCELEELTVKSRACHGFVRGVDVDAEEAAFVFESRDTRRGQPRERVEHQPGRRVRLALAGRLEAKRDLRELPDVNPL